MLRLSCTFAEYKTQRHKNRLLFSYKSTAKTTSLAWLVFKGVFLYHLCLHFFLCVEPLLLHFRAPSY